MNALDSLSNASALLPFSLQQCEHSRSKAVSSSVYLSDKIVSGNVTWKLFVEGTITKAASSPGPSLLAYVKNDTTSSTDVIYLLDLVVRSVISGKCDSFSNRFDLF
jgi:hypothetical protein